MAPLKCDWFKCFMESHSNWESEKNIGKEEICLEITICMYAYFYIILIISSRLCEIG